jgi:hypothetical protein
MLLHMYSSLLHIVWQHIWFINSYFRALLKSVLFSNTAEKMFIQRYEIYIFKESTVCYVFITNVNFLPLASGNFLASSQILELLL